MTDKFANIIDDLSERGWSAQNAFMANNYLRNLVNEEHQLWKSGEFHKARIGTGENKTFKPEIRSDHVLWLDNNNLTDLQRIYWDKMERLRIELNHNFYIGLNEFEAHFAVYPKGSFYKKHLDQFKNVKGRLISCILYLNEEWQPNYGGQLRIYLQNKEHESYVDIYPDFGTFVCFRSDQIYHEVLKSGKNRFSLTGWLKRT